MLTMVCGLCCMISDSTRHRNYMRLFVVCRLSYDFVAPAFCLYCILSFVFCNYSQLLALPVWHSATMSLNCLRWHFRNLASTHVVVLSGATRACRREYESVLRRTWANSGVLAATRASPGILVRTRVYSCEDGRTRECLGCSRPSRPQWDPSAILKIPRQF